MTNNGKNILGDVDLSKEQLSPLQAAQVARNIDSIETYRRANSMPLTRLEEVIVWIAVLGAAAYVLAGVILYVL